MRVSRARAAPGFSLVELLVALVIIGVIAAITIPSLISALDRGKQKRTMVDLRSIGQSIASYSVDNNYFPVVSDTATLASILIPDYGRQIAVEDAWGHALIYQATPVNYTLGSAGKDGGTTLSLSGSGGATHAYADDIILSNGNFVQWPEGLQE